MGMTKRNLEKITLTCAQRKKLLELYSAGYRYVTDNSEISLFPLAFCSKNRVVLEAKRKRILLCLGLSG